MTLVQIMSLSPIIIMILYHPAIIAKSWTNSKKNLAAFTSHPAQSSR